MRVGVLSDTHMHLPEDIPGEVLRQLSHVDLIVHAGDFVGSGVLEALRAVGEVKAVRGNMDSRKLKELLPDTQLLVLNGNRIGITHGWGGPWGIEHRVRELFDDVDVIIYGHSHQAKNEEIGGILFFNPGHGRRSFGLLTIEGGVKGEIIEF